jgi:hypothetical protein
MDTDMNEADVVADGELRDMSLAGPVAEGWGGEPGPGRRTEVERILEKVPLAVIEQVREWSLLPETNRHARRRKAAFGKRLRKLVPKGVSLQEVVWVA